MNERIATADHPLWPDECRDDPGGHRHEPHGEDWPDEVRVARCAYNVATRAERNPDHRRAAAAYREFLRVKEAFDVKT